MVAAGATSVGIGALLITLGGMVASFLKWAWEQVRAARTDRSAAVAGESTQRVAVIEVTQEAMMTLNARLGAEIERKDREVASMQVTIDTLRARLAEQSHRIDTLTARIAELESRR